MSERLPQTVNRLTEDHAQSVKSITGLAKALGISRPTVYEWLERDGCPGEGPDGSFDVAAWRAFAKGQGSKSAAGASDEKNRLQCDEIRLRNEALQFKNDLQRGKYTDNATLTAELAELVSEAKSVLVGKFEQELPGQLEGLKLADIRAVLKAAVDEVCERLSQPPACIAKPPAIAAEDPTEPAADV